MAFPKNLRSLNRALQTGAIDGSYRQVNPDRGGEVEPTTTYSRADLSPRLYGICEAPLKEAPGGLGSIRSENTVDAPLARIDRRNG